MFDKSLVGPVPGLAQNDLQPTVVRTPLVEIPPISNNDVWEKLYQERGAKSPRDRRRLDYALCESLNHTRADDRFVISILDSLASRAPRASVIAPKVRRLCAILKEGTGPLDRSALSELLSLSVNPLDYVDHSAENSVYTYKFGWDCQLVKLLSKYPFKGFEDESGENAISLFLECEAKNALTNARWRDRSEDDLSQKIAERLEEILGTRVPTLQEIAVNGAWGPGTHSGYPLESTETGPEIKFAVKPTLSPSLIPIASRILSHVPQWDRATRSSYGRHERFEVVEGSVLFTVPKKFLMNRVCLAEPMMESWMQAGIAACLRDLFQKATGVDLRLAWRRNQELARIGSLTGLYATSDLTSASDTNCRGPLASVLPPGWYGLLESFASSSCTLPASYCSAKNVPARHVFQMISSMGNAFTFELESILFYAIVTSVVPAVYERINGRVVKRWPHVSVFGDDLVYPTAYHDRVVTALQEMGFIPNLSKSYASGHFRESCGTDWFKGAEVRPLYITKRLDNGFQIINTANAILSMAFRRPQSRGCIHGFGDVRWAGAWTRIRSLLDSKLRSLISTPPGVPWGLWGVGSEATWESDLGQPPVYRVLGQVSVGLSLDRESIWSDNRYVWPFRLSGGNLLAARLRNAELPKKEIANKWDEVTERGVGQLSMLRRTLAHKAVNSPVTEATQWVGFRDLFY